MKRLINYKPSPMSQMWLGLLPFIILLFLYIYASDLRLTANPDDKLLPAFATLGDSIHRLALEENQRSGAILLWSDTAASLKRLTLGIGISAFLGLVVGIATGAMPLLRANLSPLVAVLSMVPPMALLPILFIVFGLGEVSKVVLIVIGIAPFIMRDMSQRVMELPKEQLIKAQTLGGSTWLIILRVILPQILPRLIDAVRLSLGAAWLFLIAAEAIASTDGLGYRIFLVRRYLSMEIILPYVAWITLLAYLFDLVMRQFSKRCFPWFEGGAKA